MGRPEVGEHWVLKPGVYDNYTEHMIKSKGYQYTPYEYPHIIMITSCYYRGKKSQDCVNDENGCIWNLRKLEKKITKEENAEYYL